MYVSNGIWHIFRENRKFYYLQRQIFPQKETCFFVCLFVCVFVFVCFVFVFVFFNIPHKLGMHCYTSMYIPFESNTPSGLLHVHVTWCFAPFIVFAHYWAEGVRLPSRFAQCSMWIHLKTTLPLFYTGKSSTGVFSNKFTY